MFGWKKKYEDLKFKIWLQIDSLRVQIRSANWHLGWDDIKDREQTELIKRACIVHAKELSELIDFEWKREYEEES